ncbi:hypothetical protein BH11ACT3_BH11ACT3_18030 [soil metagenome]
MADDDVRVPAGWYPDPLGLPQLRWWDNHAWTEHTSDARQPMVATETTGTKLAFADDEEVEFADDEPAYEDGLTRRERRERERDSLLTDDDGDQGATDIAKPFAEAETLLSLEAPVSDEITVDEPSPAMRLAEAGVLDDAPTSAPFQLDTRFDDLLGESAAVPRSAFAHVSEATTTFIPDTPAEQQYGGYASAADYMAARSARTATVADVESDLPVSTGPAWIIALIPLVVLVLGLLFLLSGLAGKASPVFIGLVVVVPYLLTVVMAIVDRQMLKKAGFKHTAHWGWAFLTAPTYLITRLAAVVRETGRGFGPLLTWGAFAVLLLGSLVAVPGLIIAMSPGTFAYEAQQSVRSDASILGADLQVTCPAVPPTLIGDSFTCAAINQDGEFFNVVVSLQRANGWIEWRVDDWGIYSMAGA